MGLFRKTKPTSPPEATSTGDPGAADIALAELRSELAAMRDRLDAADREKAELASTVDELNQRLITTAPPPPPEPSSPSPTQPDDELVRRLDELDSRMTLLDDRVTSVSTELANQVSEIGNDIEPIQAGAERLAAEQARYQIQFRQDLAELAERLRRPGS
ncbi:MAG: hypothetical protein ABWZ42_00790 [Ilumatobacteraceae bacterium]